MKNNVLKMIKYLYYFSLIVLLILYLFPGSLIGYLLYGDFGKQPDLIPNPIGTSINHALAFLYLMGFFVSDCDCASRFKEEKANNIAKVENK